MQNQEKLFGTGAYGTRVWEIWSEDRTIHIIANGALYKELVLEGKAGRSIEEQVKLRIEARIRGKLASGFKRTKEELGKTSTNQLGLVMPMTALHWKNMRFVSMANCFIQPKFDGHRCMVNSDIAYSRGGKEITTIPEIREELNLPDGVTLDGELYYHGVPLQTIASWAKRRQEATKRLQYFVYDIVVEGMPFVQRHELLTNMIQESEHVKLAETLKVNPGINVLEYYRKYRERGYEGAMLRPAHGLYTPGKRSKTLLKVKRRFDGEFECVDVIPSRDGLGILVLITDQGKKFKTNAPGTNPVKKSTLIKKENFIGRMVTCEWAELSKENIPQHCVAMRWRTDI